MPDCELKSVKEVAERIRHHIMEIKIEAFDGRSFSLTAGIGVGELKKYDNSLESFIQRVSDKTREAKQAGRNRVCP